MIASTIVTVLFDLEFLNILLFLSCEVFMDYRNFGPVIVLCTLVIGLLIMYESKKSRHKTDEKNSRFWAREREANTTRKKDISNLDYIFIPTDRLPMSPNADEEVTEYQQTLQSLSTKLILNLSGKTNTDLKLEYGVANLTALSEYDNNYTTLVNTLARWGARLFQLGNTSDAITVLEYGIEVGSDISRNFYLLAEHYAKMNRPDEIERLLQKAENITSMMKPSIIKKLNEYKDSCN